MWQVSRGIKPSLSNLQASKDVKVCIYILLPSVPPIHELPSDYPSPPRSNRVIVIAGSSDGVLGFPAAAQAGVQQIAGNGIEPAPSSAAAAQSLAPDSTASIC